MMNVHVIFGFHVASAADALELYFGSRAGLRGPQMGLIPKTAVVGHHQAAVVEMVDGGHSVRRARHHLLFDSGSSGYHSIPQHDHLLAGLILLMSPISGKLLQL